MRVSIRVMAIIIVIRSQVGWIVGTVLGRQIGYRVIMLIIAIAGVDVCTVMDVIGSEIGCRALCDFKIPLHLFYILIPGRDYLSRSRITFQRCGYLSLIAGKVIMGRLSPGGSGSKYLCLRMPVGAYGSCLRSLPVSAVSPLY